MALYGSLQAKRILRLAIANNDLSFITTDLMINNFHFFSYFPPMLCQGKHDLN